MTDWADADGATAGPSAAGNGHAEEPLPEWWGAIAKNKNGEGRDLVEVDDGDVRATVLGADAATAIEWREVEIEEVSDDHGAVRVALGDRLRDAGAAPSGFPSKLERALTVAGAEPAADPANAPSKRARTTAPTSVLRTPSSRARSERPIWYSCC